MLKQLFSIRWVLSSLHRTFKIIIKRIFAHILRSEPTKNISHQKVVTYLALLASEVRSQAHVMKLELRYETIVSEQRIWEQKNIGQNTAVMV